MSVLQECVFTDTTSLARSSSGWHLKRRGWMFLDWFLSVGAVLLAYYGQPAFNFTWVSSHPNQPSPFQAALIYPVFAVVAMHVSGLHDPLGDRRRWFAVLRVNIAIWCALALCLLGLYFISLEQIGRIILFKTWV